MKVMFVEARSPQRIVPALKSNIQKLRKFQKLCLFTTIQHIAQLRTAKLFLEKNGFKVIIQKPKKRAGCQGVRARYAGQVLGCDITATKTRADAFIYIGTGKFHPLAVARSTSAPVFKLNPFTKTLNLIDKKQTMKWFAKQTLCIDKLRRAKRVGILLSTKQGQYKPELAKKVQRHIQNSYLFIGDIIVPQMLLDFPNIDIWVNTACPRLAEDNWPKPFINAEEINF